MPCSVVHERACHALTCASHTLRVFHLCIQVWAMKESEVADLVRQLLQADKVICEQQLGWNWLPPDDALFIPSAQQGPRTAANPTGTSAQGEQAGPSSEEDATAQAAEQELQEKLRDPRYSGALSLLVDEAGFLVESKTRNMLERLSKDEAGLIAAESIVRALGVTNGPGFNALMDALSADSSLDMRAKVRHMHGQ